MTNNIRQDLVQNLRAGFRLLTFQRVSLWDFCFSVDQLVALIGLDLLISLIGYYVAALPNPSFSYYAIPVYAFSLIWLAIAPYLAGKWIKKSETLLQILIVLFSYSPLLTIMDIVLDTLKTPGKFSQTHIAWLAWIYFVYVTAITWRMFYMVCFSRKVVTLVAVFLIFVLSVINHHYYDDYKDFWYAAEPEYDYSKEKDYYAEYRKLDAEALMYKQPALLEKSLAALKPQRKHHGDIYFVGFAPYAMQDVFSKEIAYAKNVMDKRFDTQSRSINLVNHLKTVDKAPLATGTNLGLTLKHVGKLMNKDEDVLVLYLTSHGSKEHELSVNFYPLSLNDITPTKLKTMLDEAGIKWRVVIVSACYSGGYIKPLKSPNTLIATAAAADKTSFGCSNEFEFTYFGQAFFKDQLNQQTSFISALKQADIEIGKREVSEKKEPSNPQLSIGKDIEVKLQQLEKTVTAYQCGKLYQASAKC